jgi:hypothetical protein
MEFIIELLLYFFGSLLIEAIIPTLCYHTGRFLILLVSLGQLKVEQRSNDKSRIGKTFKLRFSVVDIRGNAYISKGVASTIGGFFWLIVIIGIIFSL